jgi:glycosyltransferase involved in cell wall biosynthesis
MVKVFSSDGESERRDPSPVVTVGIPSYNPGSYFRGSVESVLSQTFTNWELVISDDSATDRSAGFLTDLIAKDTRVRYVRNLSRLGLPGNFTQCARLGSGKYVTIFHQDDVMLPENLAAKVAMLDEHPNVGMVHSNIERIDSAGKVVGKHWDGSLKEDAVLPGRVFLEKMISRSNIVCAPSVLVRRSVFEEVGPFDPRLPWTCDWDMWMRIALRYDVGVIGKPQIQWRVHKGQESNRFEADLRGLQDIDFLFRLLFNERAPQLRADLKLRLRAQETLARESAARASEAWRRRQRLEAIKMWTYPLLRCRQYVLRVVYWALRRQSQRWRRLGRP